MQPKNSKMHRMEPESAKFNKLHIIWPVNIGITGVLITYTGIKRLQHFDFDFFYKVDTYTEIFFFGLKNVNIY